MTWLDSIAGTATPVAITLFVMVNAAFGAGVFLTRDRAFVNRWTTRVLAVDAVLAVAAIGAPIAALALKLAVWGLGTAGSLPALVIHGK